jgi:hypothetical protein
LIKGVKVARTNPATIQVIAERPLIKLLTNSPPPIIPSGGRNTREINSAAFAAITNSTTAKSTKAYCRRIQPKNPDINPIVLA